MTAHQQNLVNSALHMCITIRKELEAIPNGNLNLTERVPLRHALTHVDGTIMELRKSLKG